MAVPTLQRGPLALARSMIDLQHRMAGLKRDPGPAPSLAHVAVLGVSDAGRGAGRGAGVRLYPYRGPGRVSPARLCPGRHLPG